MGRKKIHETNGEKVAASRNRWKVTNISTGVTNARVEDWIPNTPEARAALKEFAAQLRRAAGTFVPEDFIF